jgi:hypothetical protein
MYINLKKKHAIWKTMIFENTTEKNTTEKKTVGKENLPRRRAPCPRLHRAPLLLCRNSKKKIIRSQCPALFTVRIKIKIKSHCREYV